MLSPGDEIPIYQLFVFMYSNTRYQGGGIKYLSGVTSGLEWERAIHINNHFKNQLFTFQMSLHSSDYKPFSSIMM